LHGGAARTVEAAATNETRVVVNMMIKAEKEQLVEQTTIKLMSWIWKPGFCLSFIKKCIRSSAKCIPVHAD
jgi:hypothetical protein